MLLLFIFLRSVKKDILTFAYGSGQLIAINTGCA